MQVVIEKAQVNKIVTSKVTVFTYKNAAAIFVKKAQFAPTVVWFMHLNAAHMSRGLVAEVV